VILAPHRLLGRLAPHAGRHDADAGGEADMVVVDYPKRLRSVLASTDYLVRLRSPSTAMTIPTSRITRNLLGRGPTVHRRSRRSWCATFPQIRLFTPRPRKAT